MRRTVLAALCALTGVGTATAEQFDLPKPEVFARAQDRERARLLGKGCVEADVGRGCHRYNAMLLRKGPCSYHIDADTTGSLPTDQCYTMERSRRFRGIWIDAFEGQAFIPAGSKPPEWPRTDPKSPGWREQMERARAGTIWLDVDRAKLPHDFNHNGRRWFIDFIGRRTAYPGAYGHMGMSGREIIVDRVIALKAMDTPDGR